MTENTGESTLFFHKMKIVVNAYLSMSSVTRTRVVFVSRWGSTGFDPKSPITSLRLFSLTRKADLIKDCVRFALLHDPCHAIHASQ